MEENWGYTYDLGNHHIYIYVYVYDYIDQLLWGSLMAQNISNMAPEGC